MADSPNHPLFRAREFTVASGTRRCWWPALALLVAASGSGLLAQDATTGSTLLEPARLTNGITRGFLYAGAARVVASLWGSDDRTTAEFMRRFYGSMPGRGERLAAALRTAQVEMGKSKGWGAPYWAAFTLLGEWR